MPCKQHKVLKLREAQEKIVDYFWFSSEFLIISYDLKFCGKKLKEFGENSKILAKKPNELVAGCYTSLPKSGQKYCL